MSIGSELRRIREDCGLSLKQVSSKIGVSIDLLSKIENDLRNPTPTQINRLSELYELPDLVDYYYEEEITKLTDDHPDTQKLLEKMVKRMKNPDRHRLNLDSPKSKWGKSSVLKDFRKYVRGGRFGKVKGFDYYLNEKGKMTKKQRETLIKKSENWMGGNELDPNMTDEEMMEVWNTFYDEYGYRIPEFKEKWEKDFLPSKEYQEREYKRLEKEVEHRPDQSDGKMTETVKRILRKRERPDTSDLG